MLEDRTSAFLYYCGFVTGDSRSKVVKKNRNTIRTILEIDEEQNSYKFKNLKDKLTHIQKIFEWSLKNEGETNYEKALAQSIKHVAKNEKLLDSIQYLCNDWRNIRNELMHALFKKKVDAVNNELYDLVEHGFDAIRIFNNATSRLKRKNLR